MRDIRLAVAIAGLCCWVSPARASEQPDPVMMVPVEGVARFIEAGGNGSLAHIFAGDSIIIIENFAPYLFAGGAAVGDWSGGMRAHLVGVTALRHRFGPAQDFSRTGDLAFFSLPTEWSGLDHGKRFKEKGGWSFVLTKQPDGWRIRNYAWAVTESSQGL